MTPGSEMDFDQFLLQLSALRNDVGEVSPSNLSFERRATLRDFIAKRIETASGEVSIGDPSLWVA